MPKRLNIFETNSSSTHSFTFGDKCKYDTLDVRPDGILEINADQDFGWEIEEYRDAKTKAAYAAIWTRDDEKLRYKLTEALKFQTGATEVHYNCTGSIDHQSSLEESGFLSSAFDTNQSLINFIFNTHTVLRTDNDNH